MPGGFSGPAAGFSCDGDWDYFRPFCDNTDATCSPEGGPCTGSGPAFDAECCAGTICVVGACRPATGGREQYGCDASECAAGLACGPVGTAMASPTCCARDTDWCEVKADCCGTMECRDHRCVGRGPGEACIVGDCVGTSFCDGATGRCT
jgi:hypothetical protein